MSGIGFAGVATRSIAVSSGPRNCDDGFSGRGLPGGGIIPARSFANHLLGNFTVLFDATEIDRGQVQRSGFRGRIVTALAGIASLWRFPDPHSSSPEQAPLGNVKLNDTELRTEQQPRRQAPVSSSVRISGVKRKSSVISIISRSVWQLWRG